MARNRQRGGAAGGSRHTPTPHHCRGNGMGCGGL